MRLHIASASGNIFGYLFRHDLPLHFSGPHIAQQLNKNLGPELALDGLFVIEPPAGQVPLKLWHWDIDGSETFCSNGTRAALGVLSTSSHESITCISNNQTLILSQDGMRCGIKMPEGPPNGFRVNPQLNYPSYVYGWIGNPQLVITTSRLQDMDLSMVAPSLRHDVQFEEGTNVNFIESIEKGKFSIRSWERGIERESLCCGTGCALAAAWMALQTDELHWEITPASDPVWVTMDHVSPLGWNNLWLTGDIRVHPSKEIHLSVP